jgi:hypothetical protein
VRQFNAPPGWPDPPNARWKPPKRWKPAESWPPAPAGWRFWVDEDGYPVRGPFGRYGGPSVLKLGAAAAVLLALIGLVLVNPFKGNDTATSLPPGVESTPTTGVETTTAPKATRTAPATEGPTGSPTVQPTNEPTPGSAREASPSSPDPSTATSSAKPKTTEPTAPPSADSAVTYQNCAEVRAAGKAPLHRCDPGYSPALDKNGDGIACDKGNS